MNVYLLLGMIPYAVLLQPIFYHFSSKRTENGFSVASRILKVQGVLIAIQTGFLVMGIITALGE